MRRIRTYSEVADPAGTEDVLAQVHAQHDRLARRLEHVRLVVAVASGKGGVGKSAVTANLAAALARRGHRVGALDADLNGPTLGRMLAARPGALRVDADGIHPAAGAAGTAVMSMDLLLDAEDAPLRWREPEGGGFIWQSTLETGALREFLSDVAWGELDVLLLDLAPGTDKLARLYGLLRPGVLILVETPSRAARVAVDRSIRQARDAGVARIGLVRNMDGYVCPHCGELGPLFGAHLEQPGSPTGPEPTGPEPTVPEPTGNAARGRARAPAAEEPELFARIPFDPQVAARTDRGEPVVLGAPDSPAAAALEVLADRVERILRAGGAP